MFIWNKLRQLRREEIKTQEREIPMTLQKARPENVIIAGGGPAALSAGLYAARSSLNPLLFEGPLPGGQLMKTSLVENYLGCDKTSGIELCERFREHALAYGIRTVPRSIMEVEKRDDGKILVRDETGEEYLSHTLIVATGATPKHLNVPGFNRLNQRGISTCAVCDGSLPLFRQKPIAVVGGGDSAMEHVLHMAKFASHLYLIHRRDKFRASPIMVGRVTSLPNINILLNSEITEVDGSSKLERVKVRNIQKNTDSVIAVGGLFVAIGHNPNTELLAKTNVRRDSDGYVQTEPGSTRTSVPGIFACGDVQDKVYRQAIFAAGMGCAAALDAQHYLDKLGVKTN